MRKKITKVVLSLMVALVCMCNCSINVFAKSDFVLTKDELLEKYSVDTGNTQADELFNSFLEKVSVLTTEDYAYFFEVNDYEGLTNFYTSRYVMHCNGTEEEWKNKEPFEQYLWDAFYVTPLEALAVYSWDEVMGDSGYFQSDIIEFFYNDYKSFDKECAEAYRELMEWQYNYLEENNAVYNFMTGEDSLGNTQSDEKDKEEQPKEEETKETSESIEDSKKDTSVKEESEDEEIEEEESEDDTSDSKIPGGLIFGVLGVLVVVIIGVIISRKSKGNNNKAA